MVEHGPNSMAMNPAIEELCHELNIYDEILPAMEESKIRQILWNDELHTLKASPLTLLTTNLISLRAKLRILKEPFIKSKSPDGESVLAFFERRFGSEVAKRIAGAIVSGIYAGDAAQLEIASVFPRFVELEKEFGSVLKGLKKSPAAPRKIVSFTNGMETLISSLSRKLTSHTHRDTKITQVRKEAEAWIISLENGEEITAGTVISTLPFKKLSELLEHIDFPKLEITYNPMLTMQVEIPLKELKTKTVGFGFLASSYERKDFIGVLYNGNVFETAINGDRSLINFFVRPDHCQLTEPADIFENLCLPLLKKWTGIAGDLQLINSRYWAKAIPQKTIGHTKKIDQIKTWEKQYPNFHVAGNSIYGVAVGDCISDHMQLVDSLLHPNSL